MNSKMKVVIAVISAVVLLACVISMCIPTKLEIQLVVPNASSANSTQTAQNTADNTTAVAVTEAAATTQAAVAPSDGTVPTTNAPASSDVATTAPASAPASTPAASSTGEKSVAEIVALYNTAVNKAKPEASTIYRNYKKLEIPSDQLELPSAIKGIANTAIGMFVKPDETVQTWTSAEDKQLGFPVGGTDYTSKLTADMVESATCKDNGTTYSIEIKLYDDKITSPEKGQGYAGVFNTTTASTFSGINVPGVTFNQVDINGVNGSIKCTVDKASQRVTEITFANTDIMKLNVKVAFSTLDCKVAMVQEENFTIEY